MKCCRRSSFANWLDGTSFLRACLRRLLQERARDGDVSVNLSPPTCVRQPVSANPGVRQPRKGLQPPAQRLPYSATLGIQRVLPPTPTGLRLSLRIELKCDCRSQLRFILCESATPLGAAGSITCTFPKVGEYANIGLTFTTPLGFCARFNAPFRTATAFS